MLDHVRSLDRSNKALFVGYVCRRRGVVCSLADRAFHGGDPILAACHHLSIEDNEVAGLDILC